MLSTAIGSTQDTVLVAESVVNFITGEQISTLQTWLQ